MMYINSMRRILMLDSRVLHMCERVVDVAGVAELQGRCLYPWQYLRRSGTVAPDDDEVVVAPDVEVAPDDEVAPGYVTTHPFDPTEEVLSHSMSIQPEVQRLSTLSQTNAGFVFFSDNEIVLGRSTRRMTFDMKDPDIVGRVGSDFLLQAFDTANGAGVRITGGRTAIKNKIGLILQQLSSAISRQNFSVILESVIRIRKGDVSTAVFSSRCLKANGYVRFVHAVAQFVFDSDYKSSERDGLVFEKRIAGEASQFLHWHKAGNVFSCSTQRAYIPPTGLPAQGIYSFPCV